MYTPLDSMGRVSLMMDLIAQKQRTLGSNLANVDTPEMHGACESETKRANAARERLVQLVPRGTVVELKNIKDDKYVGRIDANVILPDGRDVGRVLINEKHGRPYGGGKRAGWCN